MREVEAQPVGCHHRPHLAHMGAEDLAQRRVHEVRGGVVALDVAASRFVHDGLCGRRLEAVPEAPHHGAAPVHLLHVLDGDLPAVALHHAGVAHLAARLGVERILLEHHLDHALLLAARQHVGHGAGRLVPDPFLLRLGLDRDPLPLAASRLDQRAADLEARLLRAATLLGERAVEPLRVHSLAALGGDELRQVQREAVGVVQLERLVPRDDRRPLELVEALEAAFDRLEEPLLLGARGALDVRPLLLELRIDAAHHVHDAVRQVHQRRLALAEQPGVADRPAQDAAQHVAAAVAGRIHPVREQEGDRPRVVGEHAKRRPRWAAIVSATHDLDGALDDRREQVGVEVGRHALHHRGDAFQPGPRVH